MYKHLSRLLGFGALAFVLAGCAGMESRDGGQDSEPATKPQSSAQLLERAAAAQREGRLHIALNYYGQILGREPDNERANVGAGEVMLAMRRPAQALARFDHALQRSPNLVVALEGRGYALLGLRRLRMAETALNKAVSLNPARWRSWNGLGVIADLRGDSKAAQSYYEKALLVLPGKPQLLNNRAFSLMLMGHYDQAVPVLRSALEYEPKDVRIRNNLAWCLAWKKRYQEALDILEASLSPAQARNNVGYIAMRQGDLSTAETMFRNALKLSPVFYERAANNLDEVQRRMQAKAGR